MAAAQHMAHHILGTSESAINKTGNRIQYYSMNTMSSVLPEFLCQHGNDKKMASVHK